MSRFLLRRLITGCITLWLLSIIGFVGAEVLPGNPARSILGPDASAQAVAVLTHQLGLDRPALVRYVAWLSAAVRGDFGVSYALRENVDVLLRHAGWNSLLLALVAIAITFPSAILLGLAGARHEGKAVDHLVTFGGIGLMVIPGFALAILLILLFGILLPILPVSAMPADGDGFGGRLYHLLLPALVCSSTLIGYLSRVVRANALEVYHSGYVQAAYLRGLSPGKVMLRHVLKNAMIPSIIVFATQCGYLLGGLVVVEKVFNYPGLGVLLLNAAGSNDMPVLEASVVLIGLVYILLTLAADIIHSLLDPRINQGMR